MQKYQGRTAANELPSGKKIVVRELTGDDELAAAAETTGSDGLVSNLLGHRNLVYRSIVSIDGQKFDPSEHTAESARALFSPLEWQYIGELFNILHRAPEKDLESFRSSVEYGITGATVRPPAPE